MKINFQKFSKNIIFHKKKSLLDATSVRLFAKNHPVIYSVHTYTLEHRESEQRYAGRNTAFLEGKYRVISHEHRDTRAKSSPFSPATSRYKRSYYLFLTSVMPSPAHIKRKATDWLNAILLRCAFVFKPRLYGVFTTRKKSSDVGRSPRNFTTFISMQRIQSFSSHAPGKFFSRLVVGSALFPPNRVIVSSFGLQ